SSCARTERSQAQNLNFKDPVYARLLTALQQRNRNIVHWHSTESLSIESSMVCVTVHNQVCSMAIDNLCQSGGTKKRIDFRDFPADSFENRRVMKHHNTFFGS